MELKSQNSQELKIQLDKLKKRIKIVTVGMLVLFCIYIYFWIRHDESKSTYTFIVIALSFLVIRDSNKAKEIKTELEVRKQG